MSDTIELKSPLDMHLHLRDGDMLECVAPLSARSFAGAIIMPNLLPPVTDGKMLAEYRERISRAVGDEEFDLYMTLFFKESYDFEFLSSLGESLSAVKLYPAGITTNSEGGVSGFDIDRLSPALEAMSELGIPLLVHGESDGFVMDREAEFIPIYEKLAEAFPKLMIVMEHITTARSAEALDRYENLYATITLHHLLITLDDVAGGLLRPHLFCKPIAKRPEDREALLKLALDAHPKVSFGSDSAPHPRDAKEAPGCAAGVFTAPLALPALAELFDRHGKLENLQAFVSTNAIRNYGVNPPRKSVTLVRESFQVPESYGSVVPMMAGGEIGWKLA
jgi:dihydroorotase